MESASPDLQLGLQSLQLASERDLLSCRGRVRRLASGLPAFDSLWIDALVEQKLLTPFQAIYFEEKRWPDLEVNSELVLRDQIHFDRMMPLYLAAKKNSKAQFYVSRIQLDSVTKQNIQSLSELIKKNQSNDSVSSLAIDFHLRPELSMIDVISPAAEGESLNSLLVRRGRFPEQVVRSITIEICRILAEYGEGNPHGDLRLSNVLIKPNGEIGLLNAGVLNALMPTVNIHQALPADAYDGIAPERFESIKEVSVASEMYALGCLLWHLMAGRPPYLLADPLAKIAAHRQQEIKDIREIVPDCSEEFAQIISGLTSRRVLNRPKRFNDVLEALHCHQDRTQFRIRQFLETFESSAPRQQTGPPVKRNSFVLKSAVVVLLTVVFLGVFWNRDKIGLPALSEVAATTSVTEDKTEILSPQDFKPIQTVKVEPERSLPIDTPQATTTFLELPDADEQGIISLDQVGPYQISQLQHDKQIIIRSQSPTIAKLILDDSPVELAAPYIEFHNVDIELKQASDSSAALILLNSQEVQLNGCHFTSQRSSNIDIQASHPPIINWESVNHTEPTSGRLLVSNCVNSSTRALIAAKSAISTVLFQNVIQVAPQPFLELEAGAKTGMLVPIVFNSCTHSAASPAVQIKPNPEFATSGKLSIQGSNSIFAASSEIPFIGIHESYLSDEWLSHIEISAQGLIVSRDAMLFGSQTASAGWTSVNSNQVRIDGLLTGRFEFINATNDETQEEFQTTELVIEELSVRSSSGLPGFQMDAFRKYREQK